MRARKDFAEGLCQDQHACKVQFFTVVNPFGFGGDDPLFLSGRANDTIVTFDPPFELHMSTPGTSWIADGEMGGMWAVYCMKVKIIADEMQVIDSGVAFLQCLSLTVHWSNLNTAAEACNKMLCKLGMNISLKMPPPASCASSSSSAGPSAGVMVPAQQAYMPAVPILDPDDIAQGNPWCANPWSSMVDY